MAAHDDTTVSPARLRLIERELNALYQVSKVLSRSLNLRDTLQEVLEALHRQGGMERGMVALVEPDSGEMLLRGLYNNEQSVVDHVRYRAGEGVVGAILEGGSMVVVECIADEPRFLSRTGMYEPHLPFVGVPIRIGDGKPVGVLAAQPSGDARGQIGRRLHARAGTGRIGGAPQRPTRRRGPKKDGQKDWLPQNKKNTPQ